LVLKDTEYLSSSLRASLGVVAYRLTKALGLESPVVHSGRIVQEAYSAVVSFRLLPIGLLHFRNTQGFPRRLVWVYFPTILNIVAVMFYKNRAVDT